jgi:hypothetical protein
MIDQPTIAPATRFFTQCEECRVRAISEMNTNSAQGGGKPRVGDIVRIGNYPDAVQKQKWVPGGVRYWAIGRNDSGEYGASFLAEHLEPLTTEKSK